MKMTVKMVVEQARDISKTYVICINKKGLHMKAFFVSGAALLINALCAFRGGRRGALYGLLAFWPAFLAARASVVH